MSLNREYSYFSNKIPACAILAKYISPSSSIVYTLLHTPCHNASPLGPTYLKLLHCFILNFHCFNANLHCFNSNLELLPFKLCNMPLAFSLLAIISQPKFVLPPCLLSNETPHPVNLLILPPKLLPSNNTLRLTPNIISSAAIPKQR